MLKSITADAEPIGTAFQNRFVFLRGDVAEREDFAAFILDTIEKMAADLSGENNRRVMEIAAIGRRNPIESDRGTLERFGLYFYNSRDPLIIAAEYCCNAMLAKREHNRTCHIFTAFWYLCAAKRAQELRSAGVNTWKSDEMATDAMKQMTDSALCAEYLARVAVAA